MMVILSVCGIAKKVMSTQKVSKRPGRKNMVASKIKELSEEDLNYLINLLHTEIQNDPIKSSRIDRLIDALNSQKNLLAILLEW